MTRLEKLQAAPPEVREAVLELLDELSRPMTARELERALQDAGFTRSQAKPVVMVLKHLPIVAIGAGHV